MKLKLVAVLMTLGLFVACSGTGPDPELASQNRPIINGQPVGNDLTYQAVVSLHERVGDTWYLNIFCSGTLITDTVVLTAAHCLDVGHRKPSTRSPDSLVIYVGDNPVTDPSPMAYPVAETFIHPAYNSQYITNDIGLVRLAVPVEGVTPVPALPSSLGFTSADEGTLVLNFAGFGQDEDGNYDQKLQLDGLLTEVYSATQIYYLQNDGGPCFGDSGGPAFVVRNGKAYVGGMTSYGDSYCTQYGVSTRADAYESLINDFIGVTPEPFCGDHTCNDGETCSNCAVDCGACPVDPFCGDHTCDAGETCSNCAIDCGACSTDPVCGNGVCELGEDCDSCADDCPVVIHPKKGRLACCGNGVPEKREDIFTCPIDFQ